MALAETPHKKLKFSHNWFVSPHYDLSFFVFSGLLSFFFWALYSILVAWGWQPDGIAILITYFLFTSLVDLPHIFQTFARTHADPVEFNRRKTLYTWGLPIFVILGVWLESQQLEPWLIGFAALYGSYHIVRQHLGFIRLYHHLNEPQRKFDHRLDAWCFQIILICFVVYDYVETSDEVLLPLNVYGSHFGWFPVVQEEWGNLAIALSFACIGLLIWRQLELASRGEALNLPKILVMGMAILTHFCLFVIASVPFLVAEAIETAYHNMQYHGFMAHYQRQRFPHIRFVAGRWLLFAGIYGCIAGIIEVIGYTNSLFYLMFAPFSMLTLFHYYIDGKIWKFSEYPELKSLITASQEQSLS